MLVACNEFNHSVCVHYALWSHSLGVNAFPYFDSRMRGAAYAAFSACVLLVLVSSPDE